MHLEDEAKHRQFVRCFALPMALYTFALMGAIPLIRSVESDAAKVLLALLPLLPLTFAMIALVRHISGLDELQRRVHFELGGIAALLTCCLVFSWGILEIAGVPQLRAFTVLPIFCAIYLVRYWQMMRQMS